MSRTVIGFFDDAAEAQQAVQVLINSGVLQENIDLSKGRSSTSTPYTDTNASRLSSTVGENTNRPVDYDAARPGSDVDTTGTGYSDSANIQSAYDEDKHESGISRFFKNLFGDDDDADKFTRIARSSEAIVTVHAQSKDEAERAAEILDDNGAIDVDKRASDYGYSGSGYNSINPENVNTTNYNAGSTDITNNESRKIPIIEENLEVGKEEIETGGKRLRSRIVERPVEENLRLREEHVYVQRTPVDREATDSDFDKFEERDIEMIEHAEVPIVNKQARVVEEVSLKKDTDERSEKIEDTVRKTELDVENIEKKNIRRKKN
ncbi:MAG TPA: YsnF/AvaK domain-containing protein [Saprospiraceae bacterium]|nr:YsnF/AvaK domain-containing protein [Saprospiraceae bacterium]